MALNEIDTFQLSKEMNDTLVHRSCIMRSGLYLSRYLIYHNRSVDAIRLIGRCSVHDISKLQNLEEFIALASIVDEIDAMHNVNHLLSNKQKEAISLHWANNTHHPEYYESPNDMSDLDLLEMACDCHARSKQYKTSLIEYIEIQQENRFHFDSEHFKKLKSYCLVLTELTKNDDYKVVIESHKSLDFKLKDSTMEMLENFDRACYGDIIKTDRIYLKREETSDIASILYLIYLKDNTEIGYISVKCNGFIEYKIYKNYIGFGYTTESLAAFINNSTMKELYISVRKDNEAAKEDVLAVGFTPVETSENTITYRYRNNILALEPPKK